MGVARWMRLRCWVQMRAVAMYWHASTSHLYALGGLGFNRDRNEFEQDFPPPPQPKAAPESDRMTDRMSGVVMRWCHGYGFIKPDDGGDDLFCHLTSIADGNMLKSGSTVEFTKRI